MYILRSPKSDPGLLIVRVGSKYAGVCVCAEWFGRSLVWVLSNASLGWSIICSNSFGFSNKTTTTTTVQQISIGGGYGVTQWKALSIRTMIGFFFLLCFVVWWCLYGEKRDVMDFHWPILIRIWSCKQIPIGLRCHRTTCYAEKKKYIWIVFAAFVHICTIKV